MNLQELELKLRTLLEENRLPPTSNVVVKQVERRQAEGAVVGVETLKDFGSMTITVVIQVQEYY